MNKPEPLNCKGFDPYESTELECFSYQDIKSAVEWVLMAQPRESKLNNTICDLCKDKFHIYFSQSLEKDIHMFCFTCLINKAFSDVIKDEGEKV